MRNRVGFSTLLAALVFTCSAAAQVENPDADRLLALHAAGLQAHLDRNVDALLADQAEDFVLLNFGEVSTPSKQQRRDFFDPYFAATRFEFYRDRVPPVVKVSRDASLGWVVAQVEARGTRERRDGTGQPFDLVVAWVELYERRDGRWVAVGNASTFKSPD